MKKVIWLCLFLFFVVPTFGQHHGGFSGGFGHSGFGHGGASGGFGSTRFSHSVVKGDFGFPSQGFANFGLPPIAPIPPLGINAPFSAFDHRFGFGRRFSPSGAFFPSAFPVVLGGYDYGYAPAPNVFIIVQPPPQMIVAETPREPAKLEIHEYKEPSPTTASPSEQEQPAFGIALKDGSIHSAMAIWVQDDALHYFDPDGRHQRVFLTTVDRESTNRLNRERHLSLQLPPTTTK